MRRGGDNGHGAPASGSPIELSCMYSEARDWYKSRFDRLQLMEPELYSRGEGRTATGLAGTTTDREGVSAPIDEYNMHAMIDAPTRPLSLFIYMPGLNIYYIAAKRRLRISAYTSNLLRRSSSLLNLLY